MSETVLDPDVQPPPQPAVEQPPPEPQAQVAPTAEAEDEPEAVEFQPGVKYVPLGALQSVREELKTLKPLAQKAQQLEAEAAENRGIVEFIKANPQILHPQQQAQPRQVHPDHDPELVDIAKDLDLYTQDGRPDTQRAARIRARDQRTALAAAQHAIAPMEASTYEQRAASNIQDIVQTSKVAGKPLEQQYVVAALRTITTSVPKSEAMRILADPTVKEIVRLTAAGLQATAQGGSPAPAAPLPPVLQTETAGGSGETTYELPESSKRLAKAAGIKESDFAARAKKYVPGRSNILE